MDKSNRPRIKLQLMPADIVLEVLGWLALAALWGYLAYSYPGLPEIIPTHFGAGGVPDGYAGKGSVLYLQV